MNQLSPRRLTLSSAAKWVDLRTQATPGGHVVWSEPRRARHRMVELSNLRPAEWLYVHALGRSIPYGMGILPACSEPACVNPDHHELKPRPPRRRRPRHTAA